MGTLILVFSLLGVEGILGFIGGLLAIIYKPTPAGTSQQYGPPQQPYIHSHHNKPLMHNHSRRHVHVQDAEE